MNDFGRGTPLGETAFYLSLDIATPLVTVSAGSDSDNGMRNGRAHRIPRFPGDAETEPR
ncbi:Hypothetical protein NGAL_HAMBI2605_62360 [Neorhizobium galegae bv. orientalis]|nr:Hypothetical protein NGAL_HAMBI2605_62360 [Neorhizobium galegae bv. orientalis]